jgi:hypothetical protein
MIKNLKRERCELFKGIIKPDIKLERMRKTNMLSGRTVDRRRLLCVNLKTLNDVNRAMSQRREPCRQQMFYFNYFITGWIRINFFYIFYS